MNVQVTSREHGTATYHGVTSHPVIEHGILHITYRPSGAEKRSLLCVPITEVLWWTVNGL